MPLFGGKSKKSFSHNVESEMDSGKPQKQAVAIAYAKRKEKMASGGTVSSGDTTMNYADGGVIDCPHCGKSYSHGGQVANDDKPVADFSPNNFDDLALRDDLEFNYTAENSGDEDGEPDAIKRAMLKRKNK